MCPYCDPNNMETLDENSPAFWYFRTGEYTNQDTWIVRESHRELSDDTDPDDIITMNCIGIDQTGNYYILTAPGDMYDRQVYHINYCPKCGRSLVVINNEKEPNFNAI